VKTESTQKQMNKSTCNYSNSVRLKIHSNTFCKHALNRPTSTDGNEQLFKWLVM